MKQLLLGTILFFLSLPSLALAQGSGSAPPPMPMGPSGLPSESGFAVTRTVKGTIVELSPQDNRLVVEDSKGKRFEFKVAKDTKFKADKKTELHERKHITLSDFETGEPVLVVYLAQNNVPTEIRLRFEKKK